MAESNTFNAVLIYAFLSNVSLAKADWPYANFCGSNLQNSNMKGGFFYQANFKGAYLIRVDFSGANLYLADFTGAMISGADFSSANQITQDQIDQACYIPKYGKPLLPLGFNLPKPC